MQYYMVDIINHKTLIDTIQDGIFVIRDKRFYYINNSFCNIIGYTRDEIITQQFDTFVHEDDKLSVQVRHLGRLNGVYTPNEYVCRLVHKNGSTVYVMSTGVISQNLVGT